MTRWTMRGWGRLGGTGICVGCMRRTHQTPSLPQFPAVRAAGFIFYVICRLCPARNRGKVGWQRQVHEIHSNAVGCAVEGCRKARRFGTSRLAAKHVPWTLPFSGTCFLPCFCLRRRSGGAEGGLLFGQSAFSALRTLQYLGT